MDGDGYMAATAMVLLGRHCGLFLFMVVLVLFHGSNECLPIDMNIFPRTECNAALSNLTRLTNITREKRHDAYKST